MTQIQECDLGQLDVHRNTGPRKQSPATEPQGPGHVAGGASKTENKEEERGSLYIQREAHRGSRRGPSLSEPAAGKGAGKQ